MRDVVYRTRQAGLIIPPAVHGLTAPPRDHFDVRRFELYFDTVLWAAAAEGIDPQRGRMQMGWDADQHLRLAAFVLDLPSGYGTVDVDLIASRGGEFYVPVDFPTFPAARTPGDDL